MGIDITLANAREVLDQVGLVQAAIDREMGRIHYRIAQTVKDTAVAYAPRSPSASEERRIRNALRKKRMAERKIKIKERKRRRRAQKKLNDSINQLKVATYKAELAGAEKEVLANLRRAGVKMKRKKARMYAKRMIRPRKSGLTAAQLRGIRKGARTRAARAKLRPKKIKPMKKQRPEAKSKHAPGGLMRSISARSSHEMAEVFVAMNSEAGKYAYGIHELKGVTWRNRGVGTILKGPKADEKFITRAAADKEPEIIKIVEDQLTRATERFRNT